LCKALPHAIFAKRADDRTLRVPEPSFAKRADDRTLRVPEPSFAKRTPRRKQSPCEILQNGLIAGSCRSPSNLLQNGHRPEKFSEILI
jgi:hypothetical protein